MQLKRVLNVEQINMVLLDASIMNDIADDPTVGMSINECDSLEWLGVYEDECLQGVFLLVPQNSITVEIHTCLLPVLRGRRALEAGKLLLEYLFQHYQKAISWCPDINKKAVLFALMLGFKVEGINRASYLKNNELIDQQLVGLTKEEFLCQQ